MDSSRPRPGSRSDEPAPQRPPGFGSPLSYFKALSTRASAREIERIDGIDPKAFAEKRSLSQS